jgi:perosamine synthetase
MTGASGAEPHIPLARPDVGPAEEREVLAALRSGRLALGPKALEFERLTAAYAGAAWGVSVSSGTAGLHVAVRGLGIGPDDCVVTASFSFIASANCLRYEGAEPVFVDVDPDTLCLSTDAVRSYLESCKEVDGVLRDPVTGRRVAGVLPIDMFGRPAGLPAIRALADPWGLRVLSDSCEALGSRARGADGIWRHAGAEADVSVFAFYPNKQITTGEGGMVVGNDPDLEERIRSLRNQGRRSGDPWLHHARLGFNYRMDELSAALGVAQIRRVDEILGRRRQVAGWYGEALGDVEALEPPSAGEDVDPAWFVYFLRVTPGIDRDRLVEHLAARGIEAKAYFDPPIHLQPPYAGSAEPGSLPVTEDAARRTLIVPFFAGMTREEVERVAAALREGLAA